MPTFDRRTTTRPIKMKLYLESKLGDGAFADVWKAQDDLGRDVAVKIVRPAGAGIADALAHAKALARTNHQNVVTVIALDRVVDPDSGVESDCVVMELLDGSTLTERLKGPKFSVSEVREVGGAITDGIAHIHAVGMAHGDLHSDNVMVLPHGAKVIDILYLDSLALLSTAPRDARLRRDVRSLRLLLQEIIVHSELDPGEATMFNNLLDTNASIGDIKVALYRVTEPANLDDSRRRLDHAFRRLTDAGFVEGDAYAAALIDETPPSINMPLLQRIIDERIYEPRHVSYVQALWGRLSTAERAALSVRLGVAIDAETPSGRWWPLVRLLRPFAPDGWKGLPALSRLRLENLIVRDVLAGRVDIYQSGAFSAGALGSYANSLWIYFDNQRTLADNIASMLRQNWYTQNYIGKYFFEILPYLARATDTVEEMIAALTTAVRNDARIVVNKLEELPPDWVAQIRAAS